MPTMMFENLTSDDVFAGGKIRFSVDFKRKVLRFCAMYQISAHCLPRNETELMEFIRFVGWGEGLQDAELAAVLATKLLDCVRNNINNEKLRPGLVEEADYPGVTGSKWSAVWLGYTLDWADEESQFVFGRSPTTAPDDAVTEPREQVDRPYIPPAGLVRQLQQTIENEGFDADSDGEAEYIDGEDREEELVQDGDEEMQEGIEEVEEPTDTAREEAEARLQAEALRQEQATASRERRIREDAAREALRQEQATRKQRDEAAARAAASREQRIREDAAREALRQEQASRQKTDEAAAQAAASRERRIREDAAREARIAEQARQDEIRWQIEDQHAAEKKELEQLRLKERLRNEWLDQGAPGASTTPAAPTRPRPAAVGADRPRPAAAGTTRPSSTPAAGNRPKPATTSTKPATAKRPTTTAPNKDNEHWKETLNSIMNEYGDEAVPAAATNRSRPATTTRSKAKPAAAKRSATTGLNKPTGNDKTWQEILKDSFSEAQPVGETPMRRRRGFTPSRLAGKENDGLPSIHEMMEEFGDL